MTLIAKPDGPWVVRDPYPDGQEVDRGGDWSDPNVAVRVLEPVRCTKKKPHVDPNGDRDGWRDCGRLVRRTPTGTSTGRCHECYAREREKLEERRQEQEREAAAKSSGKTKAARVNEYKPKG